MNERQARTERLARGIAGRMVPLLRAETHDGKPAVTIHNEDALRAFLQVMVLEIITEERKRK